MNYFVVGTDTDVGKTTFAAELAEALHADYWKPISCGSSDTKTVAKRISGTCYPEAYSLKTPVSPHQAARIENVSLEVPGLPVSERLVIEGAGGLMSPFSETMTMLDLFLHWPGEWIVVSRYVLGNINHTMMTLDCLKSRGIIPAAIIFTGEENPDSLRFIQNHTEAPCFHLRRKNEWIQQLSALSGDLSLKS